MSSMQALLTIALMTVVANCQADPKPTEVAAEDRRFADARRQLAISIRDYADPIREQAEPRIIRVISEVPRHLFVPREQRSFAYEDEALPIGEDQTISQ